MDAPGAVDLVPAPGQRKPKLSSLHMKPRAKASPTSFDADVAQLRQLQELSKELKRLFSTLEETKLVGARLRTALRSAQGRQFK